MPIIAYIAIAYIAAFVIVGIYRVRSESQPLREATGFEPAEVKREEPVRVERRAPERPPAELGGRGKWHVHQAGKRYGPVDTKVLQKWIDRGRVKEDVLVWREGMEKWEKITEIEQFRSRFR